MSAYNFDAVHAWIDRASNPVSEAVRINAVAFVAVLLLVALVAPTVYLIAGVPMAVGVAVGSVGGFAGGFIVNTVAAVVKYVRSSGHD